MVELDLSISVGRQPMDVFADVVGKIDASMRELAEDIARSMREQVRVDTGNLFSTIRVERPRDGGGQFEPGWAIIIGGPDAPYVVPLDVRHGAMRSGTVEEVATAIIQGWKAKYAG